MTSIVFNRAGMRAVLEAAPRNDVRHYLNGVRVEARAGYTRLLATDGHLLLIFHEAHKLNKLGHAKAADLIVPYKVALSVCDKLGPREPENGNLRSVEKGQWVIAGGTDTEVTFTPVDGEFPEYQRVIPLKVSGEVAQFDPKLLYTAQKALARIGCWHFARVWHNGNSAAWVTGTDPRLFGVVMPSRAGAEECKRPDWLA